MGDSGESALIVVGVDGSENSIEALVCATGIANALHAPLQAIIAWEHPQILGSYYALVDRSPQRDAERTLGGAVDRAFRGTPALGSFTQTALRGPASRVLIEQSEQAAMLVVGGRGRGGFSALMLGSVGEACAAHSRCPVLIVRGRDSGPRAATRRDRGAPAMSYPMS